MRNAFKNPRDGRLRAGWRIALFFVAVVSVAWVFIGLAMLVHGGRPAPGLGRELVMVGSLAIATTIVLPLARRRLDRRSTRSLGLRVDRTAAADLVFGWLLSGLMAGLFVAGLALSGNLTVTGIEWSFTPLLLSFGLYVLVGWWEELFFRGYLFDNMVSGMGTKAAIAVSCVLYGLVHAGNPHATILSSAIIVGFGFLRLFGLLTTRQLWLSMGMHTGWNFFQGPVFGFAASGRGSSSLLKHETAGAEWWTGGAFGPEGSVLILPILGLALLAMRWWAERTRGSAAPIFGPALDEATDAPGAVALAAAPTQAST